jgi:hypothetical protein
VGCFLLLGLSGLLCSCRSDNLWFGSKADQNGLQGTGNHVSRLEREWRANEPASYR